MTEYQPLLDHAESNYMRNYQTNSQNFIEEVSLSVKNSNGRTVLFWDASLAKPVLKYSGEKAYERYNVSFMILKFNSNKFVLSMHYAIYYLGIWLFNWCP